MVIIIKRLRSSGVMKGLAEYKTAEEQKAFTGHCTHLCPHLQTPADTCAAGDMRRKIVRMLG